MFSRDVKITQRPVAFAPPSTLTAVNEVVDRITDSERVHTYRLKIIIFCDYCIFLIATFILTLACNSLNVFFLSQVIIIPYISVSVIPLSLCEGGHTSCSLVIQLNSWSKCAPAPNLQLASFLNTI